MMIMPRGLLLVLFFYFSLVLATLFPYILDFNIRLELLTPNFRNIYYKNSFVFSLCTVFMLSYAYI